MSTESASKVYESLLEQLGGAREAARLEREENTTFHVEKDSDGRTIFRIGMRVNDNGNVILNMESPDQRDGKRGQWRSITGRYPVTLFGDVATCLSTSGSQAAFTQFMKDNIGAINFKYGI